MHRSSITTTAILFVAVTALVAAVCMWFANGINQALGGEVAEVDVETFATPQADLAITGVSALSPDGSTMRSDLSVVISGGIIQAVGADAKAPDGYRIIDGSGLFLIPGLIDSHVHLRRQANDLLLYVANGVTSVRDLSGSSQDLSWREKIREGRLGPSLYVSSPTLFTDGFMSGLYQAFKWPRRNVRSADRAETVVGDLMEEGYDALKIYEDIDLETFEALNNVAVQRGIYSVGHLPQGYSLDALGTTNLREIAHIEELVKALKSEFREREAGDDGAEFPEYVAARADQIIDDLLKRRVAVNTTLWLMESIVRQAFELSQLLTEIALVYANPALVEGDTRYADSGWLPGSNKFEVDSDLPEDRRHWVRDAWTSRFTAHEVLFRKLVERGVTLVAGSDASAHLVIAGFSLHDELATLVRYGMTPQQALWAATAVPATLMHQKVGAISPGYRADLVLLRGNPLERIENTHEIEAVVLDGRFLNRTMLDRMLSSVAAANAESRKFDISEFE